MHELRVSYRHTQGRRGIEGAEAMARSESTQGAEAAHATGTAVFGCGETQKVTQVTQKRSIQPHPPNIRPVFFVAFRVSRTLGLS